jgi:hypothetical protein
MYVCFIRDGLRGDGALVAAPDDGRLELRLEHEVVRLAA